MPENDKDPVLFTKYTGAGVTREMAKESLADFLDLRKSRDMAVDALGPGMFDETGAFHPSADMKKSSSQKVAARAERTKTKPADVSRVDEARAKPARAERRADAAKKDATNNQQELKAPEAANTPTFSERQAQAKLDEETARTTRIEKEKEKYNTESFKSSQKEAKARDESARNTRMSEEKSYTARAKMEQRRSTEAAFKRDPKSQNAYDEIQKLETSEKTKSASREASLRDYQAKKRSFEQNMRAQQYKDISESEKSRGNTYRQMARDEERKAGALRFSSASSINERVAEKLSPELRKRWEDSSDEQETGKVLKEHQREILTRKLLAENKGLKKADITPEMLLIEVSKQQTSAEKAIHGMRSGRRALREEKSLLDVGGWLDWTAEKLEASDAADLQEAMTRRPLAALADELRGEQADRRAKQFIGAAASQPTMVQPPRQEQASLPEPAGVATESMQAARNAATPPSPQEAAASPQQVMRQMSRETATPPARTIPALPPQPNVAAEARANDVASASATISGPTKLSGSIMLVNERNMPLGMLRLDQLTVER